MNPDMNGFSVKRGFSERWFHPWEQADGVVEGGAHCGGYCSTAVRASGPASGRLLLSSPERNQADEQLELQQAKRPSGGLQRTLLWRRETEGNVLT